MSRWLLLILALIALASWQTGTGVTHRAIDWLAAQPQLGGTLLGTDATTRQEALSLLFVSTFGAPFALTVALAGIGFVLTALAEAARPAMRALTLPDAAAPVSVLTVLALTAWLGRDAWLPRSLWMLGVLARACRAIVA